MVGTKAMQQTMFDEFQIKGYWWFPQKEEKVAGNLFYSNDNIELELLGSLEDDGASFITLNEQEKEIILGLSDSGEKFTLINAMNIKSSISSGFKTESYSINSFLVGGHFKSSEEISFHSSSFRTTYITKWLGKSPFTETLTFEEDTSVVNENQLTYTPPEYFKYEVPFINAEIEEGYDAVFTGNLRENISWGFKSRINIIPSKWNNLDWFIDNNNILKNLFNLFIGLPISYENIMLYGEEIKKKSRKKYMLFIRQKSINVKEKVHSNDFVINYKDIEGNLEEIFNLWFEKQNQLQTVFNLYFSDFYKDIYLETTFLNAVQTLEIYHRKMYNSKYFDEDFYQEHSNKLEEFIVDNLPEELILKFKGMLKFGNEYSLSKRFKEIFKGFGDETKKLIIGNSKNRDKFIQQLVDTRNYLTHYDLGDKKNILMSGEKLYFSIQRLRAILTIILFKELGLDELTILNKIKENKQYSFSLPKAKDMLNK